MAMMNPCNPLHCKRHKTCKRLVSAVRDQLAFRPRYVRTNRIGWTRLMYWDALTEARWMRTQAKPSRSRVDGVNQAAIARALTKAAEARRSLIANKREYPDVPWSNRFDDPKVVEYYGADHPLVLAFAAALEAA